MFCSIPLLIVSKTYKKLCLIFCGIYLRTGPYQPKWQCTTLNQEYMLYVYRYAQTYDKYSYISCKHKYRAHNHHSTTVPWPYSTKGQRYRCTKMRSYSQQEPFYEQTYLKGTIHSLGTTRGISVICSRVFVDMYQISFVHVSTMC